MKKITAALFLTLLCLSQTGCGRTDILPPHNEIENFEVMKVFGIDKSRDDPSKVEVIFLSERATAGGSQGGSQKKKYPIVSSVGETIFEAERKIKAHSDKKEFFGYVDYILVGEKAAKEDFVKYFDFIMRDHEIRFSPKVYIIRGISVFDFISQTSSDSMFLGDRLNNIKSDVGNMSNFNEVNIIETANMLNNTRAATVLPVLEAKTTHDHAMIGGTMPEKDAESFGYAIIKDSKLVGYIDEPISRGYNFLTGIVHSSAISVKDESGMPVGLEVLNQTTTIQADFNGDTPDRVTYHTHVYSNIEEVEGPENIFARSAVDTLSKKQSDILKGEMDAVVALSKELQTDCIGLGEEIRMKYPYKWERIKDRWTEIYPGVTVVVDVSSHMRRSYDIHEPNRVEPGA